MSLLYLDHAAATPIDDQVLAAMQPYLQTQFYNPSALYEPARVVAQALSGARRDVAAVLGARASEITFTAGTTEANNLIIHGVMRKYADANILVSSIEHDSVVRVAEQYNHTKIMVNEDGLLDPEKIRQAIDDQTVLISVMYANNEIGTIQPIKRIAAVVNDIRTQRRQAGNTRPLYVHSDAAQAANYLDLHVSRLNVDFLTLGGGKIYGPKQSGVVYVRSGLELEPLLYGGGQEHGLRSGTENVAGSIGFATALTQAQALREAESQRLESIQQTLYQQLAIKFSGAVINGSLKRRLPNNIHITFPGLDNERLVLELEKRDILVATGSACNASSNEASHVLSALGLSAEAARASIRITTGRLIQAADTQRLMAALSEVCHT